MTFSRSYLEGSRRWQWANTRSKLSRSCEKFHRDSLYPQYRRKYWVGMGRFGSIIKSIRERWHEGLDRKRKLSQDRSLECSRRSIPMLNKSSTNYRYNSASYHAWHRFDIALGMTTDLDHIYRLVLEDSFKWLVNMTQQSSFDSMALESVTHGRLGSKRNSFQRSSWFI